MLLLWIYGVAKKEEKIKEETKIAQCFIRGTVRGILGQNYSNEMLELDRKLVNRKGSRM